MQNSEYPFVNPSSTCLSEDLLFFDTFSHYGTEKNNFDLVQFPSPVIIDLIKIIPLGQPVEAKIPGNVRLGATNPSNCGLEFFINDLTKQDAHTMTDLGKFYCSEKDTDFNPPLQIQTDGLLLRGSYRTLTLAIFGQIASYDEKAEEEFVSTAMASTIGASTSAVVMSAASPPAQTPASPVVSEHDLPYLVGHEILRRSEGVDEEEESEIDKSDNLKSSDLANKETSSQDIVEQVMIENSIEEDPNFKDESNIEEMNSIEGQPFASYNLVVKKQEDHSNSTDMDNNILLRRSIKSELETTTISTEDNNNNGDDTFKTVDLDDSNHPVPNQETKEWTFKVDSYQLKPLKYFPDPSMTLQERSIVANTFKKDDANFNQGVEREMEKVIEMFDSLDCTDNYKTDDWVTLLEDLTNDIANMSLSQTVSNEGMLKFLIKQVNFGLNIDLALKQRQTGFKVRHLRAGIKLATILFHCGQDAVSSLLEASIPQKVLNLYEEDQMSLPLRLLIFRCLNAACDSVKGADHLVSHKYLWKIKQLSVSKIRQKIHESYANRDLNEKDESTSKMRETEVENVEGSDITNAQPRSSRVNSDKVDTIASLNSNSNAIEEYQELSCYQYMILIILAQPTTRITIAVGNLIRKMRLFQDFMKLAAINSETLVEDSEDSVFDPDKDTQQRKRDENYVEKSFHLIQDMVNLTRDNCKNIAQPVRYLPAKAQFQTKLNQSDSFIAIFKWLKHFKILELLNSIFEFETGNESMDAVSSGQIEQYIRLQNFSLLFMQQLIDLPRGTQLFLSEDLCDTTNCLLKSLARKQPPKRSPHVRISDGIENCLSASLCRDESISAATCNDMSLRMCYNFKIFSCIDKLFQFHRELVNESERSQAPCDPEKVLHQLYILSDHPYGLNAIIKHFSSIGNLDCLLRFLDMPEHHKQLEFVKETSIDYTLELIGTFLRLNNSVLEIADEYLDTLIELCKNKDKNLSVRIRSLLPWLTPFDTDKPPPLITYSEETFRQLTRVIRRSIPNYSIPFANGFNFELPPHMITAVRILRQLCLPPQVESLIETNFDTLSIQKLCAINNLFKSSSFMAFVDGSPYDQNPNQSWNLNLQSYRINNNSSFGNSSYDETIGEQLAQIGNTFKMFQPYDDSICGELKYHYGIIQTFEQEGLKRLLNTLRELVGNYPRPIYQSAALSGFRGRIVLSYIHSVMILLHSIVCHLIDARGSEFKDTSVIPVILEVYSLLCFTPKPVDMVKITKDPQEPQQHSRKNHPNLSSLQKSINLRSNNYQLAQQTKKLIISILMSYTQMCLSVSESEEKVISKSMWTKMLKEVLDFTSSTPIFFHHGLDILTKILPSPLPCSSIMDSIDQEQLFKNINHRKLWSAHLHPLHQQIEVIISQLSICYNTSIRQLLYYLCNQLCDFSSNAACMVAKIVTDTLVLCAIKYTSFSESPNGNYNNNLSAADQSKEAEDKVNKSLGLINGVKESAYAVKMVLNLLSNLITNQAFETAFNNQLQIVGKKEEKLLSNLQATLEIFDEYRPGYVCNEQSTASGTGQNSDDCLNSSTSNSTTLVNHIIETIKSINDNMIVTASNTAVEVSPPDELTRINLLELSRKTSDRFSIASGIKQTYRLKVLLDLNSNALRSGEPNGPSSNIQPVSSLSTGPASSSKRFEHNKPYYQAESNVASKPAHNMAQSMRGRGRTSGRPDSFRSRPQNTSRPPSIHVDDFNDLYGGDNPVAAGTTAGPSANRFGQMSKSGGDYRAQLAMSGRGGSGHHQRHNQPYNMPPSEFIEPSSHRHASNSNFFNSHPSQNHHFHHHQQPPLPMHANSQYSSGGSGGGRSQQNSKAKYMKMK